MLLSYWHVFLTKPFDVDLSESRERIKGEVLVEQYYLWLTTEWEVGENGGRSGGHFRNVTQNANQNPEQ